MTNSNDFDSTQLKLLFCYSECLRWDEKLSKFIVNDTFVKVRAVTCQ